MKIGFTASATVLCIVTLSGCGVAHLVQEVGYKSDIDKMVEQIKAAHEQCDIDMQVPDLDPIRQKVEFDRVMADKDPPPFVIASNDAFPTEAERPVIAKWASIRDNCISRANALRETPSSANAKEKIQFQEQMAIGRQFYEHDGQLILALYQQKLTYGEFAKKQYEFGRDALTAELAFTQALQERDDDRQAQVQQQFADVVKEWTAYIEAVNARQPHAVQTAGG